MRRPRLIRALIVLVGLLTPADPAAAGHPWTPPLLTIDVDSLQQLTVTGRPVLAVDVRPAEAYRDGRLPGARSIPLSALVARRGEVPTDAPVVLYGGGGLEDATTAYRYLRSAGHADVFVLEGGFAAWRAHGGRVER